MKRVKVPSKNENETVYHARQAETPKYAKDNPALRMRNHLHEFSL